MTKEKLIKDIEENTSEKRETEKDLFHRVSELTRELFKEAKDDTPKSVEDLDSDIDIVRNERVREALGKEIFKYVAYNQEILVEAYKGLRDVAKENNIPVSLLLPSVKGFLTDDKILGLKEELVKRHAEGEERLEDFVNKQKNPYNFLYVDRLLSKEQLEERMSELTFLQEEYISADRTKRNELEGLIIEMFGIKKIPKDLEKYLNEVAKNEATLHSQGVENKNLLFLGSEMRPQVIKTSLNRHDVDFTSVLKLMYNMHALALRFNYESSGADNVEIDLAFDDMIIYMDQEGNYKRMVRQKYAPGQTVKELPESIKSDPEYKKAWKIFLKKVESMKSTDNFVLDITDSDAGYKKERGDVSHTGNVFVKLPTDENKKFVFTIIDPDVFDSAPGQHKFDPTEYIRKKSGLKGHISAAKMAATNWSRENLVSKWQGEYLKKELKK
jgi:hypothetical protein